MGLGGADTRTAALATLAIGVATCGAWAYSRTGASAADVARDLAVGLSYATAGLVAGRLRPGNRTGALLYAGGLTWFIGNLQGTGVPLLVGLGAWWEALNVAVLAHLLFSFPTGRLSTGASRTLVRAAYALVAGGGLLRATLFDPAVHNGATYLLCPGCTGNGLLVYRDPALFTAVDNGYRGLGAALTVACLVILVRRFRHGSAPRRRALFPVWLVLLLACVAIGWDLLHAVAPDWLPRLGPPMLVVSDLTQIAVPVAVLVGLVRLRWRRAAVGELVIDIGERPTPAQLREVAARALGDPSTRLGLLTPYARGYVDPDGLPRLPGVGSGRSVTRVGAREPEPGMPSVAAEPAPAVLVHDSSLDDERELLSAVTAAVALGLENARLAAEVDARAAAALRATDRERRRLERDLHDGAQARLVFALMSVQRIGHGLPGGADPALRESVARAGRDLRLALDELRDLAHGIYPAVLSREGLGPAVHALAQRAPLPVVVAVRPGRYPPVVEATAYFTVCEAVSNAAKHAAASAVTVAAWPERDLLVVLVSDDGVGGADPAGAGLSGLADRVVAAGGVLRVRSPAGGDTDTAPPAADRGGVGGGRSGGRAGCRGGSDERGGCRDRRRRCHQCDPGGRRPGHYVRVPRSSVRLYGLQEVQHRSGLRRLVRGWPAP